MHTDDTGRGKPAALSLLSAERPRNVGWLQAAGLLFGDWGTSRLYVLGLAFLFAGRTSFYLILLMSVLIVAVGWAYSQICRIYPDGGGVYTAAKHKSRTLAVIGALLLFADYTVTASLSALDAFHYFGLPIKHQAEEEKGKAAADVGATHYVQDAGDDIKLNHEDELAEKLSAVPAGLAEKLPTSIRETHAKSKFWYDPADKSLKQIGVMSNTEREAYLAYAPDTGYRKAVQALYDKSQPEALVAWDSPGLWAIVAIIVIGLFNLMGPKHTGGFALFAALGMVAITLLILGFALPQLPFRQIKFGDPWRHSSADTWLAFVSIVLALSGVEAIANLTGVMKRPVPVTANKAIWAVTAEVAVFNVLLALCMMAIVPLDRAEHYNDMMAYLSGIYTDRWLHGLGEWMVRIVGGLLLLSAANTAITDMISVQYLMARDSELPSVMQGLNRFGVPWLPAVVATGVPIVVLLIVHDLERLAALYAIGVIGAVAINVTLCSTHPRLRRAYRKIPMILLGIVLLSIWVTLAYVKREALLFVTIVMIVGLAARQMTKWFAGRKGVKPSLLRQAISEQLPSDVMLKPKILVGTYGSEILARPAFDVAKADGAALVVCFIRQVALSYKYDNEQRLTIDTDLAALRTFSRFLDLGHEMGVTILPVYDTGNDAAELIAEAAAIYGCNKVLIGTSRQGALYHLIKGHFQSKLEALLPPEIPVQVITASPGKDGGSGPPPVALDPVPAAPIEDKTEPASNNP